MITRIIGGYVYTPSGIRKDADIVFYDDALNLRFVMQKGRIARPL